MGKIICEVCGTSYSETATQCPICGCVRSLENVSISADEHDRSADQQQYQHVRGGRFSKTNVKKRNKNKKVEEKTPIKEETQKNNKQSNRGLVITVLVLLLAIIAVIAYIAITIVVPIMFPEKDKAEQEAQPTFVTQAPETDPVEIACTGIFLDPTEISFENIGDSVQLVARPEPENATGALAFSAIDETIATVDDQGVVTAVNYGDTAIIVEFGEYQVFCAVTVLEPVPEFVFNREDVTFATSGDEWLVYDGEIAASEVTWSTEDETIATIQDGKIVAVGQGVTTVFGEYNGVTASCIVRCDFTESEEQMIADNGPYRLDNPYGVSDTDASIPLGGSFTLYLLDKNEEKVTGVVWTVEDGSCCTVEDGLITGVSRGQANVVATYGGQSYTCIVRVT